ncbi:MAG: GNAT family N-acetyltransferase [Acidimicrobiales bacterium]
MRLRALQDSPQAFTSTFEREAAFDEATWRERATTCQWFVARDADEVVGVGGGLGSWSGDADRRELIGMWVAPSHRGRGVARALVHHVAEWARDHGAHTLSLGVLQGNDGARAAYLKMGLRPSGESMPRWNVPEESIEILAVDLRGSEDG